MIRVVVFDFDGTLVDSNSVKEACLQATLAGIPGGAAALASARANGGNRYRVFAEVAKLVRSDEDEEQVAAFGRELAARYSRCCARGIIAAPERRRARQALAILKRRGLRIWINSATPARHLPELLHRRDLARFCDGALGGPRSKLDNLRHILARERVTPRQMMMVGDGPDDCEAAHELGTWFVAITAEDRIGTPQRFAMRDLSGLVALIDRLAPRPVERVENSRR